MSGNGVAYEDIRVRTANPEGLDRTVQGLGAAVVVEGSWDGEACTVRCLGGSGGFIRYAIQAQGYGEIVGGEDKRETPQDTEDPSGV